MARTNWLWIGTWGAMAAAAMIVAPAALGGPFEKIRDFNRPGNGSILEVIPQEHLNQMQPLVPPGSGNSGGNAGGNAGNGSGLNIPDLSWPSIAGSILDAATAPDSILNRRPGGLLPGRRPGGWRPGNNGNWQPEPMPMPTVPPPSGGVVWPEGTVVVPSVPSVPSIPSVPSNALPSNPLPNNSVTGNRGLTIVNPEAAGGSVRFRIGGQTMTLASGFQQALPSGQSRVIEFDRGGGFGLARYTLTDGIYQFKIGDRGWDVVKKVFRVTIDNSQGMTGFRYLLDGQLKTVAAGEVNKHKGAFPLMAKFDRGNGGEPAEVELKSGTYRVGVNPDMGLWDLMREDSTSTSLTSNPLPTESSVLVNPLANPLP